MAWPGREGGGVKSGWRRGRSRGSAGPGAGVAREAGGLGQARPNRTHRRREGREAPDSIDQRLCKNTRCRATLRNHTHKMLIQVLLSVADFPAQCLPPAPRSTSPLARALDALTAARSIVAAVLLKPYNRRSEHLPGRPARAVTAGRQQKPTTANLSIPHPLIPSFSKSCLQCLSAAVLPSLAIWSRAQPSKTAGQSIQMPPVTSNAHRPNDGSNVLPSGRK